MIIIDHCVLRLISVLIYELQISPDCSSCNVVFTNNYNNWCSNCYNCVGRSRVDHRVQQLTSVLVHELKISPERSIKGGRRSARRAVAQLIRLGKSVQVWDRLYRPVCLLVVNTRQFLYRLLYQALMSVTAWGRAKDSYQPRDWYRVNLKLPCFDPVVMRSNLSKSISYVAVCLFNIIVGTVISCQFVKLLQ